MMTICVFFIAVPITFVSWKLESSVGREGNKLAKAKTFPTLLTFITYFNYT